MPHSQFRLDLVLLVAAFLALWGMMYAEQRGAGPSFADMSANAIQATPTTNTHPTVRQSRPTATDDFAAVFPLDEDHAHLPPELQLPPELTVPVTIEFNEISLTDLVSWLKQERHLNVVLDEEPLMSGNTLLADPITDKLRREPLHLLLDRLSLLELGWFKRDDVIVITTETTAAETLLSNSYDVSGLLQQGCKPQFLVFTIMETTSGLWEEQGDGEGTINLFRNLLNVRQTYSVQCEIAALLRALDKPTRRRILFEPDQHAKLRRDLERIVNVYLKEIPLSVALADLGWQAKTDIRLDWSTVDNPDVPLTHSLANVKLKTALDLILKPLELTWVLYKGIILITHSDDSPHELKIAVYDVRDLCRDERESQYFSQLLHDQTSGLWEQDGDGEGTFAFPKPGVLVVRQSERVLDEILELLNRYRTDRRPSKI